MCLGRVSGFCRGDCGFVDVVMEPYGEEDENRGDI